MILKLDFQSETPIYQQICNQIILWISTGMLKPGERLPTVRGLAEEAGINSMTVNKAYQQLKAEGYNRVALTSLDVIPGMEYDL